MGASVIQCPAGTWTPIVKNFGSGYPRTFHVELASADGGPLRGEWKEKRFFWIFPQPAVFGSLAPALEFHRKWINAIYSVHIKPEEDVVATVR
jgi:hypothetical protein